MTAVSRRQFLGGMATAAVIGNAGCLAWEQTGPQPQGPNLGGTPAAGGAGAQFAYRQPEITGQDADYVARTAESLKESINQATSDRHVIVWIPPDAAIDMSGESTITLENVTLASSRHTEHIGGLIYTETYGEGTSQYDGGGIFDMEANSRITGLRIRGPFSNVYDNPNYPGYLPKPDYSSKSRRYEFYDNHAARGITISSGDTRLDNTELFGWTRMAVYVDCPRSYGRDREQSYPQINNISGHDNAMDSSGYTIEVIRGHPIIQRSYFNANRHSVAGFGNPDCGFTLSECFQDEIITSFPIDMHYLGENSGSGSSPSDYKYRYRGGGLIRVLDCVFACTTTIEDSVVYNGAMQPALALQGLPLEKSVVKGNTFAHDGPDSAFSQGHLPGGTETNSLGLARWELADNEFGWNP